MKKGFGMMMALGLGVSLLGVVVLVVGLALGGRPGSVQLRNGHFHLESWGSGNQDAVQVPEMDLTSSDAPVASEQQKLEAEDVRKLEVDLSLCQLEIRPGNEGQTGAQLFLYGDLKAEHIRQEYDPETGRWELKFQPPEVNVGSREYEAVLYVPQKLKKLELDAGMGSARIADLELEILELESGMGSIKLENVVSASSDLSAEMGSITGTADLGGKNEISCDMGSVELSVPAPVEYRAVVKNSMGSVKIGSDEFTAEGKQSYGPQSADVVYQIECSMGSVELKF